MYDMGMHKLSNEKTSLLMRKATDNITAESIEEKTKTLPARCAAVETKRLHSYLELHTKLRRD
jgi:hypothetical protein